MLWRCGCECPCGACQLQSCNCECHALDPLSDHELMDLLIHEGKKMVSEVYGKNRNALMKILVTETHHPSKLLKSGIARTQAKIRNANRKSCVELSDRRLALLTQVASRGDKTSIRRLLASDKKSSTIKKPKPKPHKPKQEARKQTLAQKRLQAKKRKEERRLARCKT